MVFVDMKCFIFANPSIFNLQNYSHREVKSWWQHKLNQGNSGRAVSLKGL